MSFTAILMALLLSVGNYGDLSLVLIRPQT